MEKTSIEYDVYLPDDDHDTVDLAGPDRGGQELFPRLTARLLPDDQTVHRPLDHQDAVVHCRDEVQVAGVELNVSGDGVLVGVQLRSEVTLEQLNNVVT